MIDSSIAKAVLVPPKAVVGCEWSAHVMKGRGMVVMWSRARCSGDHSSSRHQTQGYREQFVAICKADERSDSSELKLTHSHPLVRVLLKMRWMEWPDSCDVKVTREIINRVL